MKGGLGFWSIRYTQTEIYSCPHLRFKLFDVSFLSDVSVSISDQHQKINQLSATLISCLTPSTGLNDLMGKHIKRKRHGMLKAQSLGIFKNLKHWILRFLWYQNIVFINQAYGHTPTFTNLKPFLTFPFPDWKMQIAIYRSYFYRSGRKHRAFTFQYLIKAFIQFQVMGVHKFHALKFWNGTWVQMKQ